jgi:hypothetical protein
MFQILNPKLKLLVEKLKKLFQEKYIVIKALKASNFKPMQTTN